ncbi:hypothetical protein L6261_02445 [Candidatus Parcubacteria bacterium]|nr:hypothetical protein [Candidatus Parcubacteria bacterium]
MKITKIPIKIKKGQVVTSLYHSPFDYNLFYLICFAKTGVKLRIVLDDIDNIGTDRSSPDSGFSYKEKYFLSKTERTNLRSLSLTLPKYLMTNLAYPNLKELDQEVDINNLKKVLGYEDTVDHWIKDVTNNMGVYTLVGPDKSFAFSRVDDDFILAINKAKEHLIGIVNEFSNSDEAVIFIGWLFSEDFLVKGESVSDYYLKTLNRIIERFDLSDNVRVEKMSDFLNQENAKKLLKLFGEDEKLQKDYQKSLALFKGQNYEDYPFYAISKKDGSRLLPVEKYITDPLNYLLAPKVLMLNNFNNLVLPSHASNSINIYAREVMYKNKNLNCNQIFCDDRWFDYISNFNLHLRLTDFEKKFYGFEKNNLSELSKIDFGDDSKGKYKNWVVKSTIRSIEKAKYPLIFLALLQDNLFYKEPPEMYKISIN